MLATISDRDDILTTPDITDGQRALFAIDELEWSRAGHGFFNAVRSHRPEMVSAAVWGADLIGAVEWRDGMFTVIDEVYGADWPPAGPDEEDAAWLAFDRRCDRAGRLNPSIPDVGTVDRAPIVAPARNVPRSARAYAPRIVSMGEEEIEVHAVFHWPDAPEAGVAMGGLLPFDDGDVVGNPGEIPCPAPAPENVADQLLAHVASFLLHSPDELFTPPQPARDDAADRLRYIDAVLDIGPDTPPLGPREVTRLLALSDGAIAAADVARKRGLLRAARLQRSQLETLLAST